MRKLLPLVFTIFVFVSCSTNENIQTVTNDSSEVFIKNELSGLNFVTTDKYKNKITLTFAEDKAMASGKIANVYSTSYTISGNEITFGNIASTQMMPPANLQKSEIEFLKFLPNVDKYSLNEKQLILFANNGTRVIFTKDKLDKKKECGCKIKKGENKNYKCKDKKNCPRKKIKENCDCKKADCNCKKSDCNCKNCDCGKKKCENCNCGCKDKECKDCDCGCKGKKDGNCKCKK